MARPALRAQQSSRIPALRSDLRTAGAKSALIAKLLSALERESVRYCHWKSNWQIERWLTGEGDLDLLVAPGDVARFTAVVSELGFKKVLPPPEKDLPGVINFYGYDTELEKFIHIHAHYRLIFGHDLTKNYHLPIESALIDSATRMSGMMVPSPEIELILFVIRMTLKVSAVEIIARRLLGKQRAHIRSIREELAYLDSRIEPANLIHYLRTLFPMIEPKVFESCRQMFRQDSDIYRQIWAKQRVRRSLAAYARSSSLVELGTCVSGRLGETGARIGLRTKPSKRFESGGLLIAFVGGDGSGKSTCVDEIDRWLSKRFGTKTIHMGKPPKTFPTLMVAALQRALSRLNGREISAARSELATSGGRLQQLRWLCIARDRYRLYRKARRLASNGRIVLSDRYPVPQISLMDGPKIEFGGQHSRESRFSWPLICMERWYYRQIAAPDVLIVLRVDPDTAVKRKTDEAAEHVRPRSNELWQTDWSGTRACIVDTGRELPNVLAELRTLVWESI